MVKVTLEVRLLLIPLVLVAVKVVLVNLAELTLVVVAVEEAAKAGMTV